MIKYITICIYHTELAMFSITHIFGQITYPDRCRSRCGRITEVGLYLHHLESVSGFLNLSAHCTCIRNYTGWPPKKRNSQIFRTLL